MVILAISAVLTGILIPAFTRQWQNRQKEMEIKTNLVSELSETIMKIIMSAQFIYDTNMTQGMKIFDTDDIKIEFNGAYREWKIKSAVLGTKLEAYLFKKNPKLKKEWRDFSNIVTEFYNLEGVHDTNEKRQNTLDDIAKKLSTLLYLKDTLKSDWQVLRDGILDKKCDIIKQVLNADVSVFQSGLFRNLW